MTDTKDVKIIVRASRYLKDHGQVVAKIALTPWRLARQHLDDDTAHRPDVTAAPVVLATQCLRRHEGDGTQQLALYTPTAHVYFYIIHITSQSTVNDQSNCMLKCMYI